MSGFMDGYVGVPERIERWYADHPEGRIVADPPQLVAVGERFFIASTARAYRTPDDLCPCQGSAWEPYPGTTNFTRDSEAMNAETSAIGRALAAAGVEVKKGMASRDEVSYRQPEGGPTCTVCDKALAGSKAVKQGSGYVHEACA